MSENVVSLVKPADPKAVIQRIEEMLQMAKDGEIEEFIAVIVRPDRTFSCTSSGCRSILEQIGMLHTMIYDTLRMSLK